jgi:hypothetical protein
VLLGWIRGDREHVGKKSRVRPQGLGGAITTNHVVEGQSRVDRFVVIASSPRHARLRRHPDRGVPPSPSAVGCCSGCHLLPEAILAIRGLHCGTWQPARQEGQPAFLFGGRIERSRTSTQVVGWGSRHGQNGARNGRHFEGLGWVCLLRIDKLRSPPPPQARHRPSRRYYKPPPPSPPLPPTAATVYKQPPPPLPPHGGTPLWSSYFLGTPRLSSGGPGGAAHRRCCPVNYRPPCSVGPVTALAICAQIPPPPPHPRGGH